MEAASALNPASPQGREILHLFLVTLAIAGVIFSTVAGLVVFASVRFRSRRGVPPSSTRENKGLEIIWTVIPAFIVAFLFVSTVKVMHAVNPPPSDRAPDLIVIAHQWWWELHYPQWGGVTAANEIHLPVERQLLLRIESADVDHSFWVPALGKKVDAIPKHPNHLWVTIDHPGVFLGTCSEFCGAEHAWMRIRVIGQSWPDFDAWIKRQREPAAAPASAEAVEGARLFQERTCATCHTISGTAAAGVVGPDLSHFAGRETIGSGVLTNTRGNLVKWIRGPQEIKPGCNMPDFRLPSPEIDALAGYLGELK
jgi:cytochrome c oxidase subunit 2